MKGHEKPVYGAKRKKLRSSNWITLFNKNG